VGNFRSALLGIFHSAFTAELPTLATRDLQQAWTAAWGAPPPKGARRRCLALGIA